MSPRALARCPSALNFRSDYSAAMLAAMQASIEDGAVHQRAPLDAGPASPWAGFVEIGLALRDCLATADTREALLARLLPHRALIIGPAPPGLSNGLLPALTPAQRNALGHRPLQAIGDEALRQWLIDDGRLVYGEFTQAELQAYFAAVAPFVPPGATLIDLGSGLGKVVLQGALALPLAQAVGVELLPYRHALAEAHRARMLAAGAALDPAQAQSLGARIVLRQQDMFAADVSGAELVFIYSTCFAPFMEALGAKLARELPLGALVSTTTFSLQQPAFRLLQHFPAGTLAWTSVYLYQRLGALEGTPPAAPVGLYEPEAQVWLAAARAELARLA